MTENFELDDFNMIDMKAKKVLEALSESTKGEFTKGEEIHKKTRLTPDDTNEAIKALKIVTRRNTECFSEIDSL